MGVGFESKTSRLLQDFMDGYIKLLRLTPLLVQQLFPIRGTPTQYGPNQWL